MTDRIRHVTVTLDRDMRDDDAKATLEAIRHIRGVASVAPRVVTGDDHLARMIVRSEVERELYEAIANVFERKRKTG